MKKTLLKQMTEKMNLMNVRQSYCTINTSLVYAVTDEVSEELKDSHESK